MEGFIKKSIEKTKKQGGKKTNESNNMEIENDDS